MALIASLLRLFPKPSPEAVVREHAPHVLRLLKRVFGPQADVDDVFQAVFVEVLRSLPTFHGRSSMKTWIHRIALNVAYQEMRLHYRQREQTWIGDVEEPRADQNPEEEVQQEQARRRLYAALEQLDPKKRIAIILHDVEGLTLREVAEELGRPLQTVASQVRAARRELALSMTKTSERSSSGSREGVRAK